MSVLLFLIGALAVQPGGPEPAPLHPPLHTPLGRALTAERIYVDCLVANARGFTGGRAAPHIAVNAARSRCRAELRALDDVHRSWNSSRGLGRRGLSGEDLRRLVNEATTRIVAERRGGASR